MKLQRREIEPTCPAGHARVTVPLMGVVGKSSTAAQRIGVQCDTPISHRPSGLQ